MSLIKYGQTVRVSGQLLSDTTRFLPLVTEQIGAAVRELELDYTVGPRYGPPAPYVHREPEVCDCCGRPLDDDW